MKIIFAMILTVLMTASLAKAGDKTGNGGGVWICSVNNQIQSASLVDFYEATHEFHWILAPAFNLDPMTLTDQMNMNAHSKFPQYAVRWSEILTEIKNKMQFTDGELAIVEDSLWRVRPSKESCATEWQYVQFANYTNFGTILISQQMWQSTSLPALDKAGLIWHEVIYRWMREQFGDKNSVRARQIVGLLFSNMTPPELNKSLNDILNQNNPDPQPQSSPPAQQWVCLIKNGMNFRYFYDYGSLEMLAKNKTISDCQNAGDGYGFHCKTEDVRCDSFQTNDVKYACSVTNGLNFKVFSGSGGRSTLEAEAQARKACAEDNVSAAVHCEEPVCQ